MPSIAATEPPGIVVAMSLEARSLRLRRPRDGDGSRRPRDRLAVAGPGPQRAAAAAERLVSEGAKWLLNIGVAGGLVPALRPGDLLVPEAIADGDDRFALLWPRAGLRTRVIAALSPHLRLHRGVLWTSAHALASTAAKQALAARAGAVAVDMESAAVARVAAHAGIPFVAIKAICDPVERCLPEAGLGLVLATGRVSVRGLIGVLARSPSTWRGLAATARDFSAARRTLAVAAPMILRTAALP
jgi:adenosylhomocysteine nucleosidase